MSMSFHVLHVVATRCIQYIWWYSTIQHNLDPRTLLLFTGRERVCGNLSAVKNRKVARKDPWTWRPFYTLHFCAQRFLPSPSKPPPPRREQNALRSRLIQQRKWSEFVQFIVYGDHNNMFRSRRPTDPLSKQKTRVGRVGKMSGFSIGREKKKKKKSVFPVNPDFPFSR